MEKMKIPFSPPDIGEEEINEVADTLRSGWITTGPKTKRFESQLTNYCMSDKTSLYRPILIRQPPVQYVMWAQHRL